MTRHRSAACVAMLRGAQRDAGFTVLEALISFVVFAVVAASASYGLVQAINASHGSQQRVDAANLAEVFVAEAIRQAGVIGNTPPEGRSVYGGVGPKGADGRDAEAFNVIETVVYDTPGDCNIGNLFWVHVVVRQEQTNRFLARSDARVACPRV
jgi:type II secretory pathway pseudopilin PulG